MAINEWIHPSASDQLIIASDTIVQNISPWDRLTFPDLAGNSRDDMRLSVVRKYNVTTSLFRGVPVHLQAAPDSGTRTIESSFQLPNWEFKAEFAERELMPFKLMGLLFSSDSCNQSWNIQTWNKIARQCFVKSMVPKDVGAFSRPKKMLKRKVERRLRLNGAFRPRKGNRQFWGLANFGEPPPFRSDSMIYGRAKPWSYPNTSEKRVFEIDKTIFSHQF
jgi:hypothetical protein